jgi:diacylglycerol O-acyltransferase
MKQLGILDSAFINLEQPNTPQHVGGVAFYDPSTAPGGFVRFKQVIANFEQRLLRMPLFRTRLVEVPGGIDKPYWVLDANFDVEFHMRHIALPKPGDWRQLCIQVARLHARPLDMTRPLWEAYIIEGLDNIPSLPEGSFAIYTKMHHSLVDGAGSQSFMAALHDLEPEPKPQPIPAKQEALLVDREPSSLELLTRAAINKAKGSVDLASGTASVVKDFANLGLSMMRDEVAKPDVQAPKTRFNEPVSKHRVFEGTEFDLNDFKEIKDAAKVKLNDVALAVVAGAMRKYLTEKKELPEESLAVSIPLNMRTRREETEDNNQVGAVFCDLHTDVADPVDRLGLIYETTLGAKVLGEVSPMTDTLKLAGVFSPWITKGAARFYSKNELSRHMPLNISSVVTNVPGPNFDLYCAGARMVRYFGLGVLTPGCGLFHTVFTSSGVLTISVLADRDQMPDPAVYRACIEASFVELQTAVLGKAKPKSRVSQATDEKKAPVKSKAAAKRAPSAATSVAAATEKPKRIAAKKPAAKTATPGQE